MSQHPALRIPPRSSAAGVSAEKLEDRIVSAVVNGLSGEWQQHRPPGRSEHSWKAVQDRKQPMKVRDLAHVFQVPSLKAAQAKAAVLQELESARGNERRLASRRIHHGRRREDVAR